MGFLDRFKKKDQEKETLWTKCPSCKSILYVPELKENLNVCPKCNYHFPMGSMERVKSLLTDYSVLFENVLPADPLNFRDSSPYKERLSQTQKETNLTEAIVIARGKLKDMELILCVMDFNFIGGSMGSVVGERFYRACTLSAEQKMPLFAVITSGGARMQEGILSLMQMAKTSIGVGFFDGKESALHNPANKSHHGWSICQLCLSWRCYHGRAGCFNRLCGTPGNRTDHKTTASRGFSDRRVFT